MIILAELRGRTTFLLLEDAVEVAQIVESALETDFGNAPGSVDEHTAGIAQTHLDDIIAQVTARV